MIFNALDDPIDLMTLQLVCKNWRAELKSILLRRNNWKDMCFKFVPRFWLEISVSRLNLPKLKNYQHNPDVYWTKATPEIWKSIYMSWRTWQMETKLPSAQFTTNNAIKFTESGKITCIAVNSKILIK